MQGLVDFQLSRWFSESFRGTESARVDHAIDVFLANDFECYAATCGLLGDADLRNYASKFTMPVAIIVGEEDYATPVAMAKALNAAIRTRRSKSQRRAASDADRKPGDIASRLTTTHRPDLTCRRRPPAKAEAAELPQRQR